MVNQLDLREWLEADGLGGFASGTVCGRRTRRYHALLLTATNPPTGRVVLINGAEVWVTTPSGSFPLSTQLYAPNVVHPDGFHYLFEFKSDPWPTWTFRLPDGTYIVHDLVVPHEHSATVLRWRLDAGPPEVQLTFRPLMSGRDYHSLHHENPAFRFEPSIAGERVEWQAYPGVVGAAAITNGQYEHRPLWFRRFFYSVEAERGLDSLEDLASPGEFRWSLADTDAVCILTARGSHEIRELGTENARDLAHRLVVSERARRNAFPDRLTRSADTYIVRRGGGKTIIAGYPWFTDWGRDTFISMRGLCLATGRLADAEHILSDWAGHVSEGMLPNRFPDHGDEPEFNSVDASLWFIIAVHDFLIASQASGREVPDAIRDRLLTAIDEILTGYLQGTRFHIRADADGLLAAGVPGVQLTWMDAKVGDWVVTPRIGKPVEVQALWLNALHVAALFCSAERWRPLFETGLRTFRERFWNETAQCLYDVVDEHHRHGQIDASIRPNQVLAIGGLPLCLLEEYRAHRVLDVVEQLLLTPLGLRTLSPTHAGYRGRCDGGVCDRDGAYHQGTVWPWLMGPFVEAWLRVRGNSLANKRAAQQRFIEPLLEHLNIAGVNHISEVVDGDPPHTPRGCPFQAWSLSELLRLRAML